MGGTWYLQLTVPLVQLAAWWPSCEHHRHPLSPSQPAAYPLHFAPCCNFERDTELPWCWTLGSHLKAEALCHCSAGACALWRHSQWSPQRAARRNGLAGGGTLGVIGDRVQQQATRKQAETPVKVSSRHVWCDRPRSGALYTSRIAPSSEGCDQLRAQLAGECEPHTNATTMAPPLLARLPTISSSALHNPSDPCGGTSTFGD